MYMAHILFIVLKEKVVMDEEASVGCLQGGCCLVNLVLGGISTQYLVATLLHQSLAFGWAFLIGLFAGTVTVPGAILVWLLQCAGIRF